MAWKKIDCILLNATNLEEDDLYKRKRYYVNARKSNRPREHKTHSFMFYYYAIGYPANNEQRNQHELNLGDVYSTSFANLAPVEKSHLNLKMTL